MPYSSMQPPETSLRKDESFLNKEREGEHPWECIAYESLCFLKEPPVILRVISAL